MPKKKYLSDEERTVAKRIRNREKVKAWRLAHPEDWKAIHRRSYLKSKQKSAV